MNYANFYQIHLQHFRSSNIFLKDFLLHISKFLKIHQLNIFKIKKEDCKKKTSLKNIKNKKSLSKEEQGIK